MTQRLRTVTTRPLPWSLHKPWDVLRGIWFYRVLLPLNYPRLDRGQRLICQLIGVPERAYRIRAFTGVQLSAWTEEDKLNPGLDLERYFRELKAASAKDAADLQGRRPWT